MKLIPLSQNQFAQVDDWWFDALMHWKWFAIKYKDTYYAKRMQWLPISKKYVGIRMHRFIMNTPDNLEVDHKDWNGLNNQEENMRNCTRTENNRNTRAINKFGYRGVAYEAGKYLKAHICTNGKTIHLGYFNSIEDAARAYDAKAKELFGEFAVLNFPNE
jgi:hypothetical protein